MSINKTALEIFGVTERDYRIWCKQTKRKSANIESKKEFFCLLKNGDLKKIDDNENSKLTGNENEV